MTTSHAINKIDTKDSTLPATCDCSLMTSEQATAYLDCSMRTLRELKADGEIAYHQHGRWLRFAKMDLDAFLAKTRVPARCDQPAKRRAGRIGQDGLSA